MLAGQTVVNQESSGNGGDDAQVPNLEDRNFSPHTWAELQELIAHNKLADLRRKPSDLRRYRQWSDDIARVYGSTINYLCREKLHWEPLPASTLADGPLFACKSSSLFAEPDDFKVLRNDWPYGLTPDITHLVVWLKNQLPIDSENGDLTPQSRQVIDDFIQKTFTRHIGGGDAADRVLWFKNWSSIQSIKAIDHVHVLVRNVPDTLLREWTN
ncbi:hypothetical protein MMC13_005273 [Lambiella insularis]|nr:hypothetical protein [Lambiella insularis]